MAISVFTTSGVTKQLQSKSGSFSTNKNSGGSCTVTANYSGVCIFTAHGRTGYFHISLNQNGTVIASGITSEKDNGVPVGGTNNNFDIYYSNQYEQSTCCKAFKVRQGDVIKLECGNNGDSGAGSVLWNMNIWG